MKKKDIHILVIDDDASLRKVLSDAIKKFGYTALAAANKDEAMSILRIKTVHAALIDCMLPKMNGVDLSLKMREGRFGQNPIVLTSGIFKDKGFASDSKSKTGAVDFIFKPIDLDKLKAVLDEHLSHLCTETVIPLHTLMSKSFDSARERRKTIEALEEISGYDLPFVLSVLMDAKVGGHLNMVNKAGEIYGISLAKGKITSLDSPETVSTVTLTLIQKQFITPEDLEELGEKARRGDILKTLLDEGLISPHVVPMIRNQQILEDLNRLITGEVIQFNFAQERIKEDIPGVDLDMLVPHFQDAIKNKITLKYLIEFYDGWGEYPIMEGPQYAASDSMKSFELIKDATGVTALAHERATINELVENERFNKKDLLRALHLLALKRVIIFDTVKRGSHKDDLKGRFEHMLKGIKEKNPIEIFVYFGASVECKDVEVEKIYKEFARNNHPDKLPPNTKEEVREAANKVFSLVSEAHDTLTNRDKREKWENSIKQKEAHQQIQAEEIADKALEFLRKGRFMDSYKLAKEAYELSPAMNVMLYYSWAELKAFPDIDKTALAGVAERMNTIPHEDRRVALYQFVAGLLKKAQGDLIGASACFDKSLNYDVDFLDARRELVALTRNKSTSESTSFTAKDLLNADLGQVIGGLFKKKAK